MPGFGFIEDYMAGLEFIGNDYSFSFAAAETCRLDQPPDLGLVRHCPGNNPIGACGRAVRRAVQPGKELWGQVEIASGLSGGEQLIVKGLEGITDGEKVALKQP